MTISLVTIIVVFSVSAVVLFFRRKLDTAHAAIWIVAGIIAVCLLGFLGWNTSAERVESLYYFLLFLLLLVFSLLTLIAGLAITKINVRLKKLTQELAIKIQEADTDK